MVLQIYERTPYLILACSGGKQEVRGLIKGVLMSFSISMKKYWMNTNLLPIKYTMWIIALLTVHETSKVIAQKDKH
jgi:hypothetical protein